MPEEGQSYKSLTLDVDRYQAMLDAPDLSDAKRQEMIDALWQTVIAFVDLDYELCIQDSCGKVAKDDADAKVAPASVLDSGNFQARADFAEAANSPNAPEQQKEAS